MSELFLKSLSLMGKGMLGIFVVLFLIYLCLLFLGRKPKQKKD